MRKALQISILFVGFALLLPAGLGAQATSPAAQASTQPVVYGVSERAPLRYEGEPVPTNRISLGVGVTAFFDDNVPQRNDLRLGDEAIALTSRLAIFRQSERVKFELEYTPFALLYRKLDGYDSFNHNARLNTVIRMSSHFSLGLRETFSYQNGIFQSLTGQPIQSGLGPPTALNQVVFPFTTRMLSNASGVDLIYAKSARTSFTFSGGYDRRQFGETVATQPLYNSWGASAGLQYSYRVTERTTLGVLVVHHDSTFSGGAVIGNRLRVQSESTFFSVGSHLSPTVTVTVFGGPQYVRTLGQAAAAAGTTGQWQFAGGGSITKEVRNTALELSVQRAVSDGGGMYTMVKSVSVDFGVRRRLVGRWEANLHIGAQRADSSLLQFASGTTDAAIAGIGLACPLRGGAAFRASYETAHEMTKGTLPYLANFDRNRVTIGIDYQFKAISLGR